MSESLMKTARTILFIIAAIACVVALSGCTGSSPEENVSPQPTVMPAATTDQPELSVLVITVTPAPVQATPEPAITKTDYGYILKDSPGAEDTVQVQLKAGKANFHILLPDYALGDSYTLTLTNSEGPFTYRSSHEFSGISGAGDISIVKTIPQDGSYRISLDYGDSWEIEITQ